MTEPRWLGITVVRAIHYDQISSHGGVPGLRDEALLESALARPRNLHAHEPNADLCRLAAAYGHGIARNHPFVDGNKRVAFQAMYVFLRIDGRVLEVDERSVVTMMVDLASGEIDEMTLARWLGDHTARS